MFDSIEGSMHTWQRDRHCLYRSLQNCNLSALMASWQFLPPFTEKLGERTHLPFAWNWRFLKETGWKLSSAPWNGPFFGNPTPAYREHARAVKSSLPYWHGSLGEGTIWTDNCTFSVITQPLAVRWSMSLPWVPASTGYVMWGSAMAESRTYTVPSFLMARKYPLTGLSPIIVSDLNYNDTANIFHRKMCSMP